MREWILVSRIYKYFWEITGWEWTADVIGITKAKVKSSWSFEYVFTLSKAASVTVKFVRKEEVQE